MDSVKVTAADRDAVQAFHREMAAKLMADIASGKPPTFGDDAGHDGDTIHQAFARHRQQAERETITKVCAWLREQVGDARYPGVGWIADAIEFGSPLAPE